MSGSDSKPPERTPGRRKDGKPYKEGNTREDDSYRVGRNRPPEDGQFRKGDGRKRGRREKGGKNADTEFEKELNRKVPARENGEERLVTKGHAIDLKLIDNAMRGENRAIEFVDERRRRIEERKEEEARRYHTLGDREILEQYLKERANELNIDPDLFGDPDPDRAPEADGDEENADG